MKALLWFWCAIGLALVLGVVVLQALGPPRPHAAIQAASPAVPKMARAAPSPSPPPPPAGLLEPASDLPGRMLPRIDAAGLAPAVAYAVASPPDNGRPRIALVIDGIGLDQALSLDAIRELPGPVDMAFSAYMADDAADRLSWASRAAGHECLVSVPMEPAGYPLAEEGTQALMTGASEAANRQNLYRALSRVAGCVGATGASDGGAGEVYSASGPEFSAMLAEVRRRGLLYLDARPGAALPQEAGVRGADVLIDRPATPDAPITAGLIVMRLASLERIARERGSAIGIAGPPLPVLIDRLSAWAAGLRRRGFVLVPVSGLMTGAPATR